MSTFLSLLINRHIEIGAAIKVCQANAKIVHLSIGGEAGSAHIDFDSQKDATDAAAMVWDLFGGGKGQPAGLRPFGSVKLDGFDLGSYHSCLHRTFPLTTYRHREQEACLLRRLHESFTLVSPTFAIHHPPPIHPLAPSPLPTNPRFPANSPRTNQNPTTSPPPHSVPSPTNPSP